MALRRFLTRVGREAARDVHARELLRGSAVAMVVKVLAAGAAFLMNVALARKLGAAETGLFQLAYPVLVLVAVFSRMGLDGTLTRFIAGEWAAGNRGAVITIYRNAVLWVSFLALTCGGLLYAGAPWIGAHLFKQQGLAPVMAVLALAVPVLALSVLHSQALQGLKRVAQSMTVLNVAIPLIFLFALLALPSPTAVQAAWLYLGAAVLTLVLGYAWWRAAAPYGETRLPFSRSQMIASCVPLWGVTLLAQVVQWSSQLLLGGWGSAADVALFASALRTAMLTSFVLIAVNSIAAPKFAAMHRTGDLEGLRRTAMFSLRLMLLGAVPVLVFMLLMPEWLMGLFGPEFIPAAPALQILAVGQFVNIATGTVGSLLSMSGNEKLLRANVLIAALLGVGLGVVLIGPFGITGAAIATAIAVAAQNLLGVLQVKRALGFNTMAFWRKS
ncbi:lipopolysaccharide biosynthesis protein [Thauera terpenica]